MTAKHHGKAAILFKQKAGRKFAKEKKKSCQTSWEGKQNVTKEEI